MNARPITAKGGKPYRHRFTPHDLSLMNDIKAALEKRINVRPSHTVIIRRALLLYDMFIQQEPLRPASCEIAELLRAAGRSLCKVRTPSKPRNVMHTTQEVRSRLNGEIQHG